MSRIPKAFDAGIPSRAKSGAARRCDPPESITTVTPDPWYLGYAAALAAVWRLHHDGQMVRHVMIAGGLSMKHLEEGGVDELDLAAIRAAIASSATEAMIREGWEP
jgi:hypothetical protein